MGTPEFASGCLRALVHAGLEVVAVVTTTDKPVGRGLKTAASDVKKTALELGLPVLQPLKLKDPAFLKELAAFQADLQIVVAFRMLPQEVWAMPRLGTFNLHASLLPAYRGAAPIQRALWNGETETGVTTFLLDKDLDTGGILHQEKVKIEADETAGTLHDKLLAVGAPLVVKTAEELLDGKVKPVAQASGEAMPLAPKIFRQDCYLDFSLPALNLQRQVRALSPYPGAVTVLHNPKKGVFTPFKVLECDFFEKKQTSYEQGMFETDNKHFLRIACGDGNFLALKKIQQSGKKALTIEDFLRGFRAENFEGARFGMPDPA